MEELIRKFINFFESDRISVSRKIAIPLLMLLVVLALDNILGISYYWINKIEIDYIVKVEEAKAVCESDSIILFHLDDKIEKAINRKNIFQWFASLFENANIEKNTEVNITNSDGNILSVIGKWFPEVERNQMWHTVTSSLLWVILFAILLLFLIFAPFVVEKDKVATIIAGGNLAASNIRNLECPSYEVYLIDYGCGKFNKNLWNNRQKRLKCH